MGQGASQDKEGTQRNFRIERTDNKAACKHQAGRKQKTQAPEPVTADMIKVLSDYFFPDFNNLLSRIEDPRRQDRIIYSKEHLIWLASSMFLCQHGSRNQFENERRSINFLHNLLILSETDEE